jgi:hypothetical protein
MRMKNRDSRRFIVRYAVYGSYCLSLTFYLFFYKAIYVLDTCHIFLLFGLLIIITDKLKSLMRNTSTPEGRDSEKLSDASSVE